jgi:hypothetical protein
MNNLAVCPACGYPKFGPNLCAYCVPMRTLTDDPSLDPMPAAGVQRVIPLAAS